VDGGQSKRRRRLCVEAAAVPGPGAQFGRRLCVEGGRRSPAPARSSDGGHDSPATVRSSAGGSAWRAATVPGPGAQFGRRLCVEGGRGSWPRRVVRPAALRGGRRAATVGRASLVKGVGR
jgi:hypothetical protein